MMQFAIDFAVLPCLSQAPLNCGFGAEGPRGGDVIVAGAASSDRGEAL
jgi:hypothetical protein